MPGSKPNVQDVTSSQRRWNKWKIKEITMKQVWRKQRGRQFGN